MILITFILLLQLERIIEINASNTFQIYLNDSIVQENWNLAQKTVSVLQHQLLAVGE